MESAEEHDFRIWESALQRAIIRIQTSGHVRI
jgi:hypothetical protein